ncbi:hypothetical protein [Acidithiobacillus thiooxidans]|uniref:hypothetical protein n=1 Tax=Acidithiobacillus thiooxidans TaxID=930 RepID=UPI001C07B469|nr:hypothetical protein [Acidithiobacillus thiooxidans]
MPQRKGSPYREGIKTGKGLIERAVTIGDCFAGIPTNTGKLMNLLIRFAYFKVNG